MYRCTIRKPYPLVLTLLYFRFTSSLFFHTLPADIMYSSQMLSLTYFAKDLLDKPASNIASA